MEGDVMDKLEDMASVCEFDPVTGDIPATKVEITVSCRYEAESLYIDSLNLKSLWFHGVYTSRWPHNISCLIKDAFF